MNDPNSKHQPTNSANAAGQPRSGDKTVHASWFSQAAGVVEPDSDFDAMSAKFTPHRPSVEQAIKAAIDAGHAEGARLEIPYEAPITVLGMRWLGRVAYNLTNRSKDQDNDKGKSKRQLTQTKYHYVPLTRKATRHLSDAQIEALFVHPMLVLPLEKRSRTQKQNHRAVDRATSVERGERLEARQQAALNNAEQTVRDHIDRQRGKVTWYHPRKYSRDEQPIRRSLTAATSPSETLRHGTHTLRRQSDWR